MIWMTITKTWTYGYCESCSKNSLEKIKTVREKIISGDLGRTPREDDRIQLWLKADANGTFSTSQSTVYLPVTVYA